MMLQNETQSTADLQALIDQQFDVENQIQDNVPLDSIVTPDIPAVEQRPVQEQSTEELNQLIDTSFSPAVDYQPPQERGQKDEMMLEYDDNGDVIGVVPRPENVSDDSSDIEIKSRYEQVTAEADEVEASINDLAFSIDFTIEAWVYGSNFSGAFTAISAVWGNLGDQWLLSVDTSGVLGFAWEPFSNTFLYSDDS